MWRRSRHGLAAVWIGALLCAGPVTVAAQHDAELPIAPGVDLVRSACLTCHGADLIRQQRLTREGWQREIDKMIRWGAPAKSDADKAVVLAYLTGIGARPITNRSPVSATSAGAEVFQSRCLGCHELDLVRQQRLTASGWSREVDKMIRWGAGVKDSEKDSLITYLTSGVDSPSATNPPKELQKETVAGVRGYRRVDETVACGGLVSHEALDELKRMGFKTVINLRRASEPNADVEGEGEAVRAAGLRYINLPFNAGAPDAAESVEPFLKAVTDPANLPVLIHSVQAHRAAGMLLIKRVLIDRWSVDKAMAEANDIAFSDGSAGAGVARQFALDYIGTHSK